MSGHSITVGEPAPAFVAPTRANPTFAFSSLGGRYVLLAFLPPPGPEREAALAYVRQARRLFDDNNLAFFGVIRDAESFAEAREDIPGLRWFVDPDGGIARLYGALGDDGATKPRWVLVDPMLRVLGICDLDQADALFAKLTRLGSADQHAGVEVHAPVLIVPRIFEPSFCRQLIDYYRQSGGAVSGVMREIDGMTVGVVDDFKKRRDATVHDEQIKAGVRARLGRRLLPEIERSFAFKVTRLERYIVACYDAEEGGYFRAHRDNTSKGTAHRRFAVSINLNAEEFEGGDLRFPEFGRKTYRPPTGGAVVFSCSLLHEATPVTRGTRYAFLPFLFDEPAEVIRQANAKFIVLPTQTRRDDEPEIPAVAADSP